MKTENPRLEPGTRAFCLACGEEIRWTGRRWAHDVEHRDGHAAARAHLKPVPEAATPTTRE